MENAKFQARLAEIMNSLLAQSAEMGALPTLYAATAPDVQGGDFVGPSGLMEMRGYPQKVEAKESAYDEEVAQRLWGLSEEMTGVQYAIRCAGGGDRLSVTDGRSAECIWTMDANGDNVRQVPARVHGAYELQNEHVLSW